jgi:cell division protein FtsB
VKASLTRLFYLSSLIIALAIGYHLAARDVAILRAEVAQMEAKVQALEMENDYLWKVYLEQCRSNAVMYEMLFPEEPRDEDNQGIPQKNE